MSQNDDQELLTIDCAECTMRFGIPRKFYEMRRKDGIRFKCPAGHGNVYAQPDDDPVPLREKIAALEAEVRQLKTDKAKLIHRLDQAGIEAEA